MSTPDPSLIEVGPDPGAPTLSARYADPVYRATGRRTPHWEAIEHPGARSTCDECFAVQHQTGGRWPGVRMQPRHKRIVNGTALTLCERHTIAWKERDATDKTERPRTP